MLLNDILAIIDVGHGSSAVLFSGGETAVFDTGRRSSLLEFLEEQGIERIRTVFLSHADQDHIGGLVQLLASRKVVIDRVAVNSDSEKTSEVWSDLDYELDRAHNAGELRFDVALIEGDTEKYDGGRVCVEVLGPSRFLAVRGPGSTDRDGRTISPNSISAVIKVAKNKSSVAILPGDLDDVGLADLSHRHFDIQGAVLVFPHHGGSSGISDIASYVERLCQMISPATVVFSIGRGQRGSPNPDIIGAVRRALPEVRIVCTQLSEQCSKSLPDDDPGHINNVFARGRKDRCCCGGTILVSLNDPNTVLPEPDKHAEFLAVIETPLCQMVLEPL